MAGEMGAADEQKSFASFLQKRRPFLLAYIHCCKALHERARGYAEARDHGVDGEGLVFGEAANFVGADPRQERQGCGEGGRKAQGQGRYGQDFRWGKACGVCDRAHEVCVSQGCGPGDDDGFRAWPWERECGADAGGDVVLVDGLDEGAAAVGQGHDRQFPEQDSEALDVVLALGAVDHGWVEHDTAPAGGEESRFAGENAVTMGIGPSGEFAGAAEEDEAGFGRGGGKDGGRVAGMRAGDDFFGALEGGRQGRRIGQVRNAGFARQGGVGPTRGAADDGHRFDAVQ